MMCANLRVLLLGFIVVIACGPSDPSVEATSDAGSLSPEQAAALVSDHLKDYFTPIPIQTWSFSSVINGKGPMNKLISQLEPWAKTGLIDFKVSTGLDGGWKEQVAVSLTEKGRAAPQLREPGRDDNRYFLAGHRVAFEVVDLNAEEGVVLFSYEFEPNELGQQLGITRSKNRGKAKIEYDPFLRKYRVRGIDISPWEEEKWEATFWTYVKDGIQVVSRERVSATNPN